MFVRSIRCSKGRVLLCTALILALIAAISFLPDLLGEKAAPVSLILQSGKVADNDARVAYLASYGWEVEEEAEAIEEIVIPEEFSEVFQKYNEIQKEQGFDLEKQKGQRVKRYTYVVTGGAGLCASQPVHLQEQGGWRRYLLSAGGRRLPAWL